SGGPVAGAVKFFKVPAESVIVIHDELDLPFGTVRLKRGGGENGHNGLRSISKSLGTRNYLRVRFGIDRPTGRMDPADYVLRDFSTVEKKELAYFIDRCADAVGAVVSEGLAAAQNRFHRELGGSLRGHQRGAGRTLQLARRRLRQRPRFQHQHC